MIVGSALHSVPLSAVTLADRFVPTYFQIVDDDNVAAGRDVVAAAAAVNDGAVMLLTPTTIVSPHMANLHYCQWAM